MAKAFVAAVSTAVGDDFTFIASGPRFVWHSAATNIRILECHVTREQDRWVVVAMGGVVAAQDWEAMSVSSPVLVPDRIDRVRQVPIELHGSYQDLRTHVLPRGAKGPDLNSVAFKRLIASIVDWVGNLEPAERR